ncbi:hypothetical protein FOA43_002169 [Brettanomyces nanus]|uniref:Solute-binding protein family 3/N-terminal domain-containing protein n=1 Tax=Eeniella nana TaxID=13502 RepID=A0A875S1N6_EENNA|nr:uncharacterized protein FOA43_002169 [Brettanomyces nanus]QPG74833.1 hypothetical protein FOA43_002169 [Brettanomyces nanus]
MTLKVGYIPEHFSTPIAFAAKYDYFGENGLTNVQLIPYPSGSGHLISSLKTREIDIAIGLTEAFVRGLCQGDGGDYQISGEYVESPLCWSISSGNGREDVNKIEDLEGKRIGVSRIGSGSYIMSYVLALEQDFGKSTFEFKILENFENLRNSVNNRSTDAFMWEYFTTKKYYDSGELKKIGEIYTPWSSWVISSSTSKDVQELVPMFLKSIQQGINYYNEHEDEALDDILENLDYNSRDDLKEWAKRVQFTKDVTKIYFNKNIIKTKDVLKTAGLITDDDSVVLRRLKQGVRSEM